jgi:predicted oxidoreductase
VLGTNNLKRITSAARSLSMRMELQDWFAVWSAASGAEVP